MRPARNRRLAILRLRSGTRREAPASSDDMRRIVLLLTLVAAALSAHAAQRVTVDDLQRILTVESQSNEKDGAIARRLGLLELTERLTEPQLQRITAEFKPGPKTALALEMLADISSFLEP